jgi:MFS family permease
MEALNFRGARRDVLRTLTDTEWKDILSHWAWVRLALPLRQVCGDDLPDWVRSEIDQDITDNTERFERIKIAYLEIATALRDANLEHLVLKGFAQWPADMQGPNVRTQSDIDLFCPAGSVLPARDALCELGYRWLPGLVEDKLPDHLPPLEKPREWQWRGKHFDPEIPASVELHFRFWNEARTRLRPMGLEQFWFRRVERQLDDFTFPALDQPDSLAYAALHALRHLLIGKLLPYHVYEISWFLHANVDNQPFWKKRQELHHDSLRSLEAVCFRLARDWFGCRLPEEVDQEIRSLPTPVQQWFQEYGDSPLACLLRPNQDSLWLHLSLLKSPADKRSVLCRGFFPIPVPPVVAVKGWTLRNYREFVVHAISRVPYHSRRVPRTLWGGFRWWWSRNDLGKQFWTFLAAFACFDIGMAIFFFLLNLFLLDYGYTEKFLGQVRSAGALGGLAGAIPAGILAQRFGLRSTMLGSLALLALFSALLTLLVSPVPQLCLAFLAGAATIIWSVCTFPAVAQLTSEQNRPVGFSLMMSSGIGLGVVAGLVGGHLPGWLARIEPMATPGQLKQAALLAACGVVALALWPASRLRFASVPGPEKKLYPRNPFVFRFLAAMAVWSLVTGAFAPFYNAYFSQHLRMPLRQIGMVSAASQLSQVLAILAAPLLFRKVGLVSGIVYTQVATALALVCLAGTSTMWGAAMVYVGFTAFLWMGEPGMFSLLMDRVAPSERAGASALILLAMSLPHAIEAPLAGASFVRYGYPAVLGVTAGVAFVAALLFLQLLGERPQTATDPIPENCISRN